MSQPEPREEAVFEAALRLSADQRAAYLDQACAGDNSLRRRVEVLLGAFGRAGAFLKPPVVSPSERTAPPPSPAEKPGDRIGKYKLLEQIGEGGCGVVYVAEQEVPLRRRVALKVIKLGMDTKQVIARFDAERQALALMDHPNIAKILDAGVTDAPVAGSAGFQPADHLSRSGVNTLGNQLVAGLGSQSPISNRQTLENQNALPSADPLRAGSPAIVPTGSRSEPLLPGRPYFVMELVRGIKITDFCDEQKIPTEERLRLFIQVCQAIQHAHQKGIIHRDIKPSNILVTVNDGRPVPKVIDFGIAKATQGRLTDQTVYTAFEQFIGTPAYMSPEQAVMTSLDIDTRSDIYSLGVLLYELLTGCTPFDSKALLAAGLDEMRRTIREREPLRPSTKLNGLTGDELTTTAKRRSSDAPKLINLVRGDLDWIVMKALEKDRTRRYETANGLAMDIARHLRHEPVQARPPGRIYKFQKLVHRNKLAFAAAFALSIALLFGAVASSSQAIRARRAEAAAMHSQEQAEAMNRFLTEDLLYQATPEVNASEKNVTMKEVLEKAARKLEHDPQIAAQPELEARLRLAVGNTYFKLGILGEAERHLRRAVTLRQASPALGPRHEQTLAARETLAWLLVGGLKSPEGEPFSRETWQTRRQVLGPDHPDTLDSMDTYGTSLATQKKYEESEQIYRECLERRRRVLGTNDINFLVTLGNLAQMLAERGDLAQAEPVVREVIERRTSAGYGDTTDTFANINNLAIILFTTDRVAQAERMLADACSRATQIFGPENPVSTLRLQHGRARVLAEQRRFAEAAELAAQTLATYRRVPSSHEGTARTLLVLGRVKVEQGYLDEAGPLLREASDLFREYSPSRRELLAQAAAWLGAIQVARQAYPEAENLLLRDADQFSSTAVQLSPAERRAGLHHIVQLYQRWGKPEQAAAWQRKLDQIPAPSSK